MAFIAANNKDVIDELVEIFPQHTKEIITHIYDEVAQIFEGTDCTKQLVLLSCTDRLLEETTNGNISVTRNQLGNNSQLKKNTTTDSNPRNLGFVSLSNNLLQNSLVDGSSPDKGKKRKRKRTSIYPITGSSYIAPTLTSPSISSSYALPTLSVPAFNSTLSTPFMNTPSSSKLPQPSIYSTLQQPLVPASTTSTAVNSLIYSQPLPPSTIATQSTLASPSPSTFLPIFSTPSTIPHAPFILPATPPLTPQIPTTVAFTKHNQPIPSSLPTDQVLLSMIKPARHVPRAVSKPVDLNLRKGMVDFDSHTVHLVKNVVPGVCPDYVIKLIGHHQDGTLINDVVTSITNQLVDECYPNEAIEEEENCKYPKHWPLGDEVSLIFASNNDTMKIKNKFQSSLKDLEIVQVMEVVNRRLYKNYLSKREDMIKFSDNLNEMQLWHGTNCNSIKAICHQNFDFRLNSRAVYGRGSYFARDASYSHQYVMSVQNGNGFLFLADVLVGDYTNGRPEHMRPPMKDNEKLTTYDSTVNDARQPSIFIIFDMAQTYPRYIVQYEWKPIPLPKPKIQPIAKKTKKKK